MIFKKQAITSILLELDSTDLAKKYADHLKNILAVQVLEITNNQKSVAKMLEHDKRIIEKRGNNPAEYLMYESSSNNEMLTLGKVLKIYYQKTFYNNDGKLVLNRDLSLSELFIMLGTFEIILRTRKRDLSSCERQINILGQIRKSKTSLEKYLNALSSLDDLEILVQENRDLIELIQSHMNLIKEAIYNILGLDREQITFIEEEKIMRRAISLTLSFKDLNRTYKDRMRRPLSTIDEIVFLDFSGENSDALSGILIPNSKYKRYVKEGV